MIPLTILQVASSLPGWGGTEIHLINLAAGLTSRGHNVSVLCQPGSYIDDLAAAHALPRAHAKVRHPLDFDDFDAILSELRTKPYDVVHAHYYVDCIVPTFAAKMRGVPVVVATQHLPFILGMPKHDAFHYGNLLHRLFCVSDDVKRGMETSGIDPKLLKTIYHGTDVDKFCATTRTVAEIRAEQQVPDGSILLGAVGRISGEKGIATLLDATSLLAQRNIYTSIVGRGPQQAELEVRVRTDGALENVRFAGYKDDVNNYIAALDVLVLPSTWREPCAAVVQQAMALQKPVIGTAIGGTSELVEHGVTGLLVPPRSAEDLAAAIATLAADADLRGRMGRAGFERVSSRFTLAEMIDTIEGEYLTFLSK